MDKRLLFVVGMMFALLAACGGDSVEKLRADGKKYYEQGNYKEARKCFVTALAKAPADEDLLFYAGLAYQKDYMYDSAIYYLKRADIMNPNNREINEQIYAVAKKLADYPNVISAIHVLAATGDGMDPYYEELSYTFAKDNEPGQAFYYARKATARGTDDPEIYLTAASRSADYDSIQVALALLDTAMTKWPDDPRFPEIKALVYYHTGKLLAAEMILRPLAEAAPPGMETFRFDLARVLVDQNSRAKKQEGLAMLEKLQPLMPPGSPIDSVIAAVRQQLGQ